MNDFHDSMNDCPVNVSHRGLRGREISPNKFMLVCSECGADIRLADNDFREGIKTSRVRKGGGK